MSPITTLTVKKVGFPDEIVVVPALSAGEVRRVDIELGGAGVGDWELY